MPGCFLLLPQLQSVREYLSLQLLRLMLQLMEVR